MTESSIQTSIIKYLNSLDILCFRHNAVKLRQGSNRVEFSRLPTLEKGVADIICCVNGKYVEIEVKTLTGRQSLEQKAHEKRVIAHGGHYFVARSVSDVKEALCSLK